MGGVWVGEQGGLLGRRGQEDKFRERSAQDVFLRPSKVWLILGRKLSDGWWMTVCPTEAPEPQLERAQ